MPKRQHLGSHNSSAHPDEQMGHAPQGLRSSTVRKTLKKIAAKKRRQRDKGTSNA